jgi:hypothetical protein
LEKINLAGYSRNRSLALHTLHQAIFDHTPIKRQKILLIQKLPQGFFPGKRFLVHQIRQVNLLKGGSSFASEKE